MNTFAFLVFGWLLAIGAALVADSLLQTLGIVCLGFALLLAIQHGPGDRE